MIGEEATRKYFWHFFSCDYDFTIAMGEGPYLVLVANTKCIFYRFQTLNVISTAYHRITNCYGKPNKKGMPWHSEA